MKSLLGATTYTCSDTVGRCAQGAWLLLSGGRSFRMQTCSAVMASGSIEALSDWVELGAPADIRKTKDCGTGPSHLGS
eukprot:248940-Amphidinium_carterae.1